MLDLNHQPEMLFDTTGMTQDEWEETREVIGVGYSENATILGDSKFKTNLDIFREKCGIVGDVGTGPLAPDIATMTNEHEEDEYNA